MKLGLQLAHDGGRGRGMTELGDLAQLAEEVGVASVWVPEHVVFVEGAQSRYPYSESGEISLGKRPGTYDPLVALAYVAARTRDVRLGTGVLILPERLPLVLAQQVVALDHASGGRFDLGIGVGWLREEFDAIGIPWSKRGRRTDEYVEAMKVLWRDDRCAYDGEFVSFEGVLAWPKPLQEPHPPIWVGGNTDAALERAARLGDGWFGWLVAHDRLDEHLERLRRACDAAGREPGEVRLCLGLPWTEPLNKLAPYAAALAARGVEQLIVNPFVPGVDQRSRIEELGRLASATVGA